MLPPPYSHITFPLLPLWLPSMYSPILPPPYSHTASPLLPQCFFPIPTLPPLFKLCTKHHETLVAGMQIIAGSRENYLAVNTIFLAVKHYFFLQNVFKCCQMIVIYLFHLFTPSNLGIVCQRHARVGLRPKYPPIIARFPPVKNFSYIPGLTKDIPTRMIKFKSAQETNRTSNLFWFLWHEVTGDMALSFLISYCLAIYQGSKNYWKRMMITLKVSVY